MMERNDLAALGENILGEMIAHPPSDPTNYLFRVTSGTTGKGPLVLVTGYTSEAPNDVAHGERAGKMLTFNGSVSSRLANAFLVSRTPAHNAMRVLSLDIADLAPPLEELLSDYAPDQVHGFRSFIARGLAFFSPMAAGSVKRIILTGEGLNASFEATLRKTFPRAIVVEKYMALEVGGYIGNRFCPHLPRGHFHPARGVHIEIAEPDEDGIGDILISKIIFPSVQLERYRIGDAGRIVPGACACGEPFTFELVGRRGIDRIKLGGATLTREEFDRVASKFPDFIDDYRAEVHLERALVRMLIFRRAGAGTKALSDELATKIARSLFVTQTRTFQDLVDVGALAPLVVEFTDAPFARGHKDVKLRVVPA